MEQIQEILQRMKNSSGILEKYQSLQEEVLKDKWVVHFLSQYSAITADEIERSIPRLFEYRNERNNCAQCTSLVACPNMMKGYEPSLSFDGKKIYVHYQPCSKKIISEEKRRQQQLIKSLYIPKEILSASFETIEKEESTRMNAIVKAFEFASTVIPGETGKGLYLHGEFGVGKTYIMGAVANMLAEREISSMLVYTPDFFRELKAGIHDGSYNEKLELVKHVPVLILDDLGAETMSSWIRDDILGAILQHRMLEKLPILYTSNYDFDELEEHLTYSQKGGIEKLKSKRIMERIRHFAEPIYLKGKNRRGN